jgi:hypothetical protein
MKNKIRVNFPPSHANSSLNQYLYSNPIKPNISSAAQNFILQSLLYQLDNQTVLNKYEIRISTINLAGLSPVFSEYSDVRIYSNISSRIYSYSKIFVPFLPAEYIRIFIRHVFCIPNIFGYSFGEASDKEYFRIFC